MYRIVEAAQGLVQFLHDAPYSIAWQFQTGAAQFNGGPIIPALHIVGGGGTPTGTGSAQASFTTITGTDVAGRLQITTAAKQTGAQGILLFANAYGSAPYVNLTPVAPTGSINFGVSVTSSTNGFTVFTQLDVPPSATISWNYTVVG